VLNVNWLGVCDNGECDGTEECCSCPEDCEPCVCGDGTCDEPCEGCDECIEDCGECPGSCSPADLTYDDPNRALDRIWAAAMSADLKSTIEDFPEQLDTIVGERGVTLSGGQKQRATLARGFIREAPVLILDDCFSSVDTETEEHILSELKRLRHGQTTLLVSHRVSTARHSDRIVIMDEGRIIEVGSHEELIARGGQYAELERIQREGAIDSDYQALGVT
ncbi:MAG: ABC transporter ATP-binding protein, partial [Proteobacteria bacterium]|nr:ABC transporter ATP-binding protein [Pseudomonadota bacterium]